MGYTSSKTQMNFLFPHYYSNYKYFYPQISNQKYYTNTTINEDYNLVKNSNTTLTIY